MKRFFIKNKEGREFILRIDDADAYLMRSYAWGVSHRSGTHEVRRAARPGCHILLNRLILNCADDEIVRFRNGDSLDFRRENLEAMPRKAFFAAISGQARRMRQLNKLIGANHANA